MSGFIYAIESGGLIKLGYSKNPEKRLNKIASDTPFPCELLGQWPGTVADELDVHDKFAEERARGEWFRTTPRLLAFIAENAVVVGVTPSRRTTVQPGDSPLTAWRKRAGLTQQDMADRLGICVSQANHIENGRFGCSLEVAIKILDMTAGDVPIRSLLPRKVEAA